MNADDALLLLHDPRCSKSRTAKALLEERGASFSLRLYLEDPLSRAELDELRRRRPIFARGARAVVGRPPERVLDLL